MAEAGQVVCHCCSQVCEPERLDARPDPAHPGCWRIVEVHGPADAPHLVWHASGMCCECHARRALAVLRAQRERTRGETLLALTRAYDGACGTLEGQDEGGSEPLALRD